MSLNEREVKSAFLRKLIESGLTEKHAKRLGFVPLTKEGLEKKYPSLTALPAAGFVLPYPDINGKFTGFYRYRYLEEPIRKGFAALTANKVIRYIQPSGERPRVYFSRLCDWPELFSREDRTLFITEGELKANCACSLGIPCLGLGGVWNFRSRSESLIKDLAAIDWEGVSAYIIYDSDARSNYQVMMAENALAGELLARGAKLFIVRLPVIEEGRKAGLDDFLVAKGADELFTLVEATEPWEESRILHELNEEVVFVHDPGSVLELKTLQRMTPGAFALSIYANRTWDEKTVNAKNGTEKVVKRQAAVEWMKWPSRAEVRRTTYLPGADRITEDRELNTWPGWGLDESLIKKGNVSLWTELIAYLLNGETQDNIEWFHQWLAYPLQHPGFKMYSATVVWGLFHGTGKTLVGHTMQRIYGKNFAEIADRELIGTFNEWAENRQFVMGDEITGGDKRSNGDRMKGMITQKFLRVNPKFISPYTVPDCINYYFTSNHPDSFFFENHDRRYAVFEVMGKPLSEAFYREYDRWYRSDEVGALFYHLLNLDLKEFNPKGHAPDTRAKREMMEMGASDLGEWCATLREEPEKILKVGASPLTYSLMTTEELFRLYDPQESKRVTKPGLSRELRRQGFRKVNLGETVTTRTAGPQRLWAIRNRETLLKIVRGPKLAEIYDKERSLTGGQKEVKF